MKGKNVASLFIEKAKEIGREKDIFNIRIDTHEKNVSMQRMVEKNGFKKTGIIYVKDGSPRYAYQLIVCK
jgi:ribosomal protein S18 acetylase RimI-like enzyme